MIAICTHLMQDRERCDALLAAACTDVSAMEWGRAVRSVSDATQALARHLQLEEQYLFGPYDAVMEGGALVTGALRGEHARVNATLVLLEQAAADHERERFLQHAEALRALLVHHHLKEQDAFYPLVARLLKARYALVSAPRSSPSYPPHSALAADTHSG
jgi:hypothetical protein